MRPRLRAALWLGAAALSLGLGLFAAAPVAADDRPLEQQLADRVKAFELPNGLKLLVLRRPEVPVFSAVTMVDVGSVDEHVGITGVAHLFEHMAFKGTRSIGGNDPDKEAKAIEELDALFLALKRERQKGGGRPDQVARLERAFQAKLEEAQRYVVNNEYSVVVERNGGARLNASTGYDTTQYFVSFPSNRLALWLHLEGDRFARPVLREFYQEKDVVLEERRMRTESNPIGKLIEEFLAAAYKAHPYGYPTVGHASDMKAITRLQAEAFYERFYNPNNMVVAIVGDVDPDEAHALAKETLGKLQRGPQPPVVETIEPPQEGEKRVTIESTAQPIVAIGYHKPSALHPDEPVWQVISLLLSDGRTSRLHKRLVKERQIALDAGGFTGFPGEKYPNLFILYALPTVGHEAAELEAALLEEVERLQREPVAADELARVKTRARASSIRGLSSNEGLAMALASAETQRADYREAFRDADRLDRVTAEDIQRVARETFTRKNRIVGTIVKPEAEGAAAPAEGAGDATAEGDDR